MSFALSPLQQSIAEAARNSEKIVAQEIVTAINLAQSSTEKTSYEAFIPARSRDKCELLVKNGIVKITFEEDGKRNIVFAHYVVTRDNVVMNTTKGYIECKKERIEIEKTSVGGQPTVIVR